MVDSEIIIHTNQISLLYVDDEEILLTLGKQFLERTGEFQVDIVDSAESALHFISSDKFDAVVSDYQMPGMDGIELLKAVREQGNDIPFILFTGRGREEVVIEAINNGADFYLQKGGDPKSQFAELSHKIKQAIRRKHAEKSLKDSQKQLADIIDFLPDATFAIDRSGEIIAWNRAIEEMTGYSSVQMLGKGEYEYAIPFYGHRRPILLDLFHEPNMTISQHYAKISRSGNAIEAEAELVNKKGEQLFLFVKASPLYDNDGKISGAIESIRDITELKRYAHQLQENETKYRNLTEYSRDAILIVGFDGTIHFINSAGITMVEEDSLDTILARKNVMTYIHPDSRELVLHDIEQVTQGNDAYFSQYKLITGKNHEIWVESQGRKIPLDGSEAIFVTLRDITLRKQVERDRDEYLQNLLSQQNFTRALLDAIPLPVLWKDAQLRYLGCNEACSRIFGVDKDDLEGKTTEEVWPDHTHVLEILQHDQDLLKYKKLEPFQRKLTDRFGTVHNVIVSKNLFYDHTGNIAGIVGSIQDITDYKTLLQDLKSQEELFRMIVTRSSDIFIIISPQYEVTYISPNHSNLSGFLTEDVLGPAGRFVHPDDLPVVLKRLDRLMTNTSSTETAIFRTRKRDGSFFYLEGVAVNCIDNPVIRGILITARDITEQKLLMSKLNESINQKEVLEKLVEERTAEISNLLEIKNLLITAIAHDLRTPLTPLIALLPLLEHEDDEQKRVEIIRIMQKNATMIASIVQTLLQMNDLGTSCRIEDTSEINLNELIRNLLNVHSITANTKGITIHMEIPATIFICSSVPHIISIFDNIISNALKYSDSGGTIRIFSKDLGEMIGIFVQDDGIGLSERELSRIFEPFFKADPSRHDRSSSGLGLSVTKRLVQAIGGEIFIHSKGPGCGTEVEIRLKK